MGHLEWHDRPPTVSRPTPGQASGPVLLAAFEGWDDAGDAATCAVEHLWEQWGAVTVASIDPEEFYDFTSTRPRSRLDGSGGRIIDWPANELGWARPGGTDGVVLLRGVEPQLRWRTFCTTVLDAADVLGCTRVVTVGSMLAEVPHTRPTPVFGTALDARCEEDRLPGVAENDGPIGILDALHATGAERGLPTASMWAAVPSYAPATSSPKAAAALAARAGRVVGAAVDTGVLDLGALSYERQLGELVAEDDVTRTYVELLERRHDGDEGLDGGSARLDADGLLSEVERFLREQ